MSELILTTYDWVCGEPLLQNVGHALELGLKALLVERGWDDDRCRTEVRHDIAKALGETAKVGFVPAHPDLAALVATISPTISGTDCPNWWPPAAWRCRPIRPWP